MALGILTLTACSTLVKACTDATDVAPMSDYRALTLKQPMPWAICYAGKDIENRTWPVPPKLLERPCFECHQSGIARGFNEFGHVEEFMCIRCGPNRFEPLRVFIHAGQQWDGEGNEFVAYSEAASFVYRATNRKRSFTTTGPGQWFPTSHPDDDIRNDWEIDGPALPFGAVVAVATITGSHTESSAIAGVCQRLPYDVCSPWALFNQGEDAIYGRPMHHWQLTDVIVLDTPVSAKGRQGLWKPDPELVAAVEAQL